MADLVTTGLAKIEIGTIAVDGGIATSWAVIGKTAEESASFTEEDPTTTEFFAEEVDDPIFSSSKQGIRTFNWSLAAADIPQIVTVLGGTTSGSGDSLKWVAPAQIPVIEKSIRVIPTNGHVLFITRAKITAKIDGGFSKTDNMKIAIVGTILTPTKANEPGWGFITIASTEPEP